MAKQNSKTFSFKLLKDCVFMGENKKKGEQVEVTEAQATVIAQQGLIEIKGQ